MVSLSLADIRDGPTGPFNYERHRPETTLLYQIIEEHLPRFQQHLDQQGKHLPAFVTQEFEGFLACGRLDRGFLRVRCESCHNEKLVAFSCKRRGFCPSCGARRVSRYLEKAGYLERDAESAYLNLQTDDEDAMAPIVGASISYRLAFGPNAGRKALTLQTIPASDSTDRNDLVSRNSGFSLHAGVACTAKQRKKLERLCRYITRPAISEQRLSLANNGNIIYALKTPYDDGTTHVILSPMEFIGRLAALVPKPRINLIRFHGVFSPNSKLREKVVRARSAGHESKGKPKAYVMTWAQRLKRVFNIEIEKCDKCGGKLKVIASIEDPEVIDKILKHLGLDQSSGSARSQHNRSPPGSAFEETTTLF